MDFSLNNLQRLICYKIPKANKFICLSHTPEIFSVSKDLKDVYIFIKKCHGASFILRRGIQQLEIPLFKFKIL